MWISKPMTSDCIKFYVRQDITVVKETVKALRVRLEESKDKISIWMPKKLIRGFKTTQAWFWRPMFLQNVQDAKNKIKKQQKINFNRPNL